MKGAVRMWAYENNVITEYPPAHHKEFNGIAERAIRTIKTKLR